MKRRNIEFETYSGGTTDGRRCQVSHLERASFFNGLSKLHQQQLWLSLLILGSTACSAGPEDCNAPSAAAQVVYKLGQDNPSWLDSPFPSSLFQDEDGTLSWELLPNPYGVELIDFYQDTAEAEVRGAGLTSPSYVQFTQPLDLRSLPRGNSDETVSPDSSIYLVDIDPHSPERGSLIPFRWTWNSEVTPFLPSSTLALAPSWGRPLRPDTLYAWVLTTAVKATDGTGIKPSGWSRALLDGNPSESCQGTDSVQNREVLVEESALLRRWLDDTGREPHKIAAHFTFRTQPLFQDMRAARDWLDNTSSPPQFSESYGSFGTAQSPYKERTYQWSETESITYRTVSTSVALPNFQEGTVPYSKDGGFYREDGVLKPYRFEEVRSHISFPLTPAPTDGWPVVLYVHGTGGDVTSGHASTAGRLAAQGFAMVSMELPLHGDRAEGRSFDIGVSTFNFLNPAAGRANFRQGAIDILSFLEAISNGLTIPAEVAGLDEEVRLRTGPAHFFGHSQGGLSGALAMPFYDSAQGWVLSGAGGGLTVTLLERKDSVDFEALIRFLLEFEEDDVLDAFHPVLALVQTAVDITDPLHFARYSASLESAQPHVLITNGCWDAQTPYKTTDALALALEVPLVEPVSRDDHPFSSPLGERTEDPEVKDGRLKGFVEWCEVSTRDNHWVVFNRPQAIESTLYFLRDVEAGTPSIRKPLESTLR